MSYSQLLDDLNPIQKQAVCAADGPTLILAGAGSGKTKVLTHRVAYLIQEKSIPPENICVLTFTNKAANEMKTRILKLLNSQPRTPNYPPLARLAFGGQPIMGTFHSLCAKILRKDGGAIGLKPQFTIYDEGDSLEAIKGAMKILDIATQKTSPFAVKNIISGAKNEMINALEYPRFARGYFQETVAKIYLEYQKTLERNQAADFDDLLLLTVKLFQNHPDILSKYQIQFRYILIDEYQDTNAVQYLLSKLFAKRYQNICVVGDASQSIYSFRGADFRNIVNFKNDYPQAKVFNLEQNYRSTQIILDAAFAVISKNNSHPILKLWTKNSEGEKIQMIEARNEDEEGVFIVRQILESGQSLSNFAVLYRTNAQSRSLEEIFLKAGLPYILVGGTRFYERKEIKDILAYLRLAANKEDLVSASRIVKIGKGRTNKFYELLESLGENLNNLNTLELLDQILEKTTYLEYIDDGTDTGKIRIENVKELRSVAEQFPNLTAFLENVTLVESEYSADEKLKRQNKEAVTLTTLHQAKGLEWPVVFIVGMEEGLFPHSRCLLDPGELEEERRLCYVGITRAKEKLYLIYTRQRLIFGSRSNNLVSRFLMDIPPHLTQNNSTFQEFNENLNEQFSEKGLDDDWLKKDDF